MTTNSAEAFKLPKHQMTGEGGQCMALRQPRVLNTVNKEIALRIHAVWIALPSTTIEYLSMVQDGLQPQ